MPTLTWTETGVPVSTRFDDPYFSLEDGLAETAHVFLSGNDLPARFRPGFHIAELGFGTGLNALAAWAAWQEAGHDGPLRFTSFEAFPLTPEDMAEALSGFPLLTGHSSALIEAWGRGARLIRLDGLELEIIEGDANTTLPGWPGRADAWFLDGFSPVKNPELWSDPLLREVARHTSPGGSFATYTAAGSVRRALTAAGFTVERAPGFGRKRHMTKGRL